jgi:hypothetical protein
MLQIRIRDFIPPPPFLKLDPDGKTGSVPVTPGTLTGLTRGWYLENSFSGLSYELSLLVDLFGAHKSLALKLGHFIYLEVSKKVKMFYNNMRNIQLFIFFLTGCS